MARLYQRRILPQIASGVIQRKWKRYRARAMALEKAAKKKTTAANAAMRAGVRGFGGGGGGGAHGGGSANVWERHRASNGEKA